MPMLQNKVILYLTDIHVNIEEKLLVRQYFEEMKQFLLHNHMAEKINYLVITGDLTCTGSNEEYKEASILIDHLSKDVLNLHSSQIYMCPGNHDADNSEIPGTFEHYKEFVQNFYRNDMITMQKSILVTSINSCTQCILSEPDNALLLEEDLLKCRTLAKNQKLKILIMHHQPEVYQNKEMLYSVIGNYDVVLYGHTHIKNADIKHIKKALLINGCAFHDPQQIGLSSFHTIEIRDEITVITCQNKGTGYKITENKRTRWKGRTIEKNGSKSR